MDPNEREGIEPGRSRYLVVEFGRRLTRDEDADQTGLRRGREFECQRHPSMSTADRVRPSIQPRRGLGIEHIQSQALICRNALSPDPSCQPVPTGSRQDRVLAHVAIEYILASLEADFQPPPTFTRLIFVADCLDDIRSINDAPV